MTASPLPDVSDARDEHRSLVLAPIERLLSPAIVLPAQLAALHPAVRDDDGPRRLMLAVLRDAVHTLTVVRARTRGTTQAIREAQAWVDSDERDHLFAFQRVCEELRVDPSYVRRGLDAWAAGMRPFLRRRRRRRRGAAAPQHPLAASAARAARPVPEPARPLRRVA